MARIETKLLNAIYPQQFGAKGDGVNDDAPAIQSALNAVSSSLSGGIVYFLPGTYLLSSSWLTVPQNNTHIVGAGRDLVNIKSILTYPGNNPANGLRGLFNFFNRSGITAEGISLQGTAVPPTALTGWHGDNQGGTAEKGFYFTSNTSPTNLFPITYNDIRVSSCRVSNTRGEAYYAENSSTTLGDRIEISKNEAIGCASNSYNVNAGPSGAFTTVIIEDNFESDGNGGIQAGGVFVSIKNNKKMGGRQTSATWILPSGLYNVISNNMAIGTNSQLDNVALISLVSFSSSNNWNFSAVVENNVFADNVMAGGPSCPGCIDVSANGGPFIIRNNTIYANGFTGSSAGSCGISVGSSYSSGQGPSSNTDVLIENNTIYSGSAGQQITGVLITGSSSNRIIVSNNKLFVSTPTAYYTIPMIDYGNQQTSGSSINSQLDNRYVLTSSYIDTSFTASLNAFTASMNLASSSFATSIVNLTNASSSFANISSSYGSLSGSYTQISGNFITLSSSYVNVSSSYNSLSSSYTIISATFGSLSSSYTNTSSSFATSINGFNTFTASLTSSIQAMADNRYILTASSNQQIINSSVAITGNVFITGTISCPVYQGSQSEAFGASTNIGTTNNNLAIGNSAAAAGGQSTAVGKSSNASGGQAIAIGASAASTSTLTIAIGNNSTANSGHAIAIGDSCNSTSQHSIAIGSSANCGGNNNSGIAIGNTAKAGGVSIAIGNGSTTSTVDNALAIGQFASASAANMGVIGAPSANINMTIYGTLSLSSSVSSSLSSVNGPLILSSSISSIIAISGGLSLLGPYTSASLPTAPPTGTLAYVSDIGFLAIYTGNVSKWMRIASSSF